MSDPGRLGGDDRLTQWLNLLRELVLSCRIASGRGYRYRIGTAGTTLDIDAGGGGAGQSAIRYRGTYSPTETYTRGDIVRVQTGASQGVWICVGDGLPAGTPPVFPEPITTGGTNNWDMWVFGVQASVDCQNGNRVIYLNASQPIT